MTTTKPGEGATGAMKPGKQGKRSRLLCPIDFYIATLEEKGPDGTTDYELIQPGDVDKECAKCGWDWT